MRRTVIELVVERAVAGGRMLARHEGRVVLVAGAIPGERIHARVERATRAVVWADTAEVLEPSPDRRPPACDPACGGALYAHIRYERQRQLKGEVIADAFRRIGKIDLTPPDVAASPEHGYRLRARLHVRHGIAGFFREGTHTLCDAAATQQLHQDALPAIAAVLSTMHARLADIDSVILAENIAATERVVHVLAREQTSFEGVRVELDDRGLVTGITASDATRQRVLAGDSSVTDSAKGLFGDAPPIDASVTWRRSAASFFQANRFLLGTLVRKVLAASSGDACVDLYSGVGLFAIALAARGSRVVAVEGDPHSVADLAQNAVPWRERLRVVHSAVETFTAGDAPPADVVVIDPPRAGASKEALDGIIRWKTPRVVYVSCDPPTLARDAARLRAAGYDLASIEAFDLFPNTPHVETLAIFDCKRG